MPERTVSEHTLSRRQFLAAASLSTAAVLGACALTATPTALPAPTSTPNPSPAVPGSYQTNRLILGEDAGTTAMPNPFTLRQIPIRDFRDPAFNTVCQNGTLVPAGGLPANVLAAVYYPFKDNVRDHRVPAPNPLSLIQGPYPVLLYAHGFRRPDEGCITASPLNRDFTTVDAMLRHVASYGCVCVAPDLSWLPGGFAKDDPATQDAFDQRGVVLVDYYTYLADVLNDTLFAKQLDFSRVVLVGHSTGAGGATRAGSIISGFSHPKSLCYGLIAPVPGVATSDVRNLVALRGGQDTLQGADPLGAYTAGGTPKTLVTIPGANHFGYTSLCNADNICDNYIGDAPGTIMRADQQQAGAAYLAALVRYYAQGDATALPYLTGAKPVEGLEALNLQVQATFPLTAKP